MGNGLMSGFAQMKGDKMQSEEKRRLYTWKFLLHKPNGNHRKNFKTETHNIKGNRGEKIAKCHQIKRQKHKEKETMDTQSYQKKDKTAIKNPHVNNHPKCKWTKLINKKHRVVCWIYKKTQLYSAFRRRISAVRTTYS